MKKKMTLLEKALASKANKPSPFRRVHEDQRAELIELALAFGAKAITITQVVKATGWNPNSVYGRLSAYLMTAVRDGSVKVTKK